MHNDHLVKMANQIASFFASYPDQDQAAAETAAHIRKFWVPEMRERLIAHAQEADGIGLAPLARKAAELLRGHHQDVM